MRDGGWPERIGWLIAGIVTPGIMFAIAGLVWSLAVGFGIGKGALVGGVVGASIGFLIVLGPIFFGATLLTGAKGMMLMLGNFWIVTVIIGLVVWLIRSLI